jgi:hypothetical protein
MQFDAQNIKCQVKLCPTGEFLNFGARLIDL